MGNETMNPTRGLFLNNQAYKVVKLLAQVILPALGAMYFSLSGIWGLPAADQVVGTIVVVDTFLGVILSVSTSSYNNSDAKFDGTLDVVTDTNGTQQHLLNLHGDPATIKDRDEFTFKVNKPN